MSHQTQTVHLFREVQLSRTSIRLLSLLLAQAVQRFGDVRMSRTMITPTAACLGCAEGSERFEPRSDYFDVCGCTYICVCRGCGLGRDYMYKAVKCVLLYSPRDA